MCSSSHHTLVFCLNYIQWVLWQKVQARRYLRWVTKPLVFQFPPLSSRNKNHPQPYLSPRRQIQVTGWMEKWLADCKVLLQMLYKQHRWCCPWVCTRASDETQLPEDVKEDAGPAVRPRPRSRSGGSHQALEPSSAGQSGESTALLSHSQGSTPSSATLPALWCQTSDLTSLRCSFCIFKI